MLKFILDTNIFDAILKDHISLELIRKKGEMYVTNAQISELKNTPNQDKRFQLLAIIENLKPIRLNLASGIWMDDFYWDDNQPWIDDISDTCKLLTGNATNKKRWKDALIGDVAKVNGLVLITNDKKFRTRAQSVGIKSILFDDFMRNV